MFDEERKISACLLVIFMIATLCVAMIDGIVTPHPSPLTCQPLCYSFPPLAAQQRERPCHYSLHLRPIQRFLMVFLVLHPLREDMYQKLVQIKLWSSPAYISLKRRHHVLIDLTCHGLRLYHIAS